MTLKDFLNRGDRFAAQAGCRIVEIGEGYARAEMTVTENHLNGGGVCQGGALFTLADLALAAVTNSHGQLTLGIGNNVAYLRSAQLGDKLTAEAVEVYNHRRIPYIDVKVTNQTGDLICVVTGLAYRKDREMAFDSLM